MLRAEPALVEEVKWKKPSKPEGVPVWSLDGIVCIGEMLKSAHGGHDDQPPPRGSAT